MEEVRSTLLRTRRLALLFMPGWPRRKSWLRACFWVAAVLPAWSQERPLKVMVLADMEGVSGVTNGDQVFFQHPKEYTEGRRWLTADVNAAIAGLKEAGATEIVVVDGHGSGNSQGPDVLEDEIEAPATVHYQDAPFDIYMDSYDPSFDAIVAVGMHAAAGNRAGFLAHTYTGGDRQYKVNGVPFNESMILAMGASRMKIPVIMVAGDDQLGKEIARHLPWVQYAVVKRAVDSTHAERFPVEEVERRIKEAARRALEKLDQTALPEFPGPYRFSLTFPTDEQALGAALMKGTELQPDRLSVQIRANDFEQGYRLSTKLIILASVLSSSTTPQKYWGAR